MPAGDAPWPRWCRKGLCLAASVVPGLAVAGGTAAPPALVGEAFSAHARYLGELALAHEHGEGVPKDPLRAVTLYCEAARLGDVEAMYALGWIYANGRGVPRDDALAGTLFAMAAYMGHHHAARMARFTGDYVGEVPQCLHPPETIDSDGWTVEMRIQAMSAERQAVARMVVELAQEFRIEPRLALAIAITESSLNPRALSPKNAMGVMQLIPETAKRFNVRNPYDPRENIRGGLAYLRWLLAYFRGDVMLAAAAYNAGEGAVDRHLGVPPYRETRSYVERILAFVKQRRHPYDSRVTAPSPRLSAIRPVGQQESGS